MMVHAICCMTAFYLNSLKNDIVTIQPFFFSVVLNSYLLLIYMQLSKLINLYITTIL